ncbi:MAG: hypothetical protein ACYC7E_05090 [Armatimonadota bacterium]
MRTALHGLVLAGVFTVGSLVGPYLWHLGTADAQAGPPRGIAANAPAANPVQPAFSQTLRAKTFEVVDDTGRARISMTATQLGAKITMFDANGKSRLLLESQGGVDDKKVTQSKTMIYLMDPNGKSRLTIADNGGADNNAAIGVWDAKGNVRNALGYADKSGPYTAIYDDKQKLLYLISPSTITATATTTGTGTQPGADANANANGKKFFTADPQFAKFKTSQVAADIRQYYGNNSRNYEPTRYQAIMDCLGGVDPRTIQNKMGDPQTGKMYTQGVSIVYDAFVRYLNGVTTTTTR